MKYEGATLADLHACAPGIEPGAGDGVLCEAVTPFDLDSSPVNETPGLAGRG